MVLSKRNAQGDFVIWSSSSQADPEPTQHANNCDEGPALKRARVSESHNSSPAQQSNVRLDSVSVPQNKSTELASSNASTNLRQRQASTHDARAIQQLIPSPQASSSAIVLPSYCTPSVGSSQPYSSVATTKRGPKKTSKTSQEPEKRQALFKKKCPQNITERVERVMTQRIFMIDRNRIGDLKEEFSVLGSTGNVYTVAIDHVPRCSCPDSIKGNHCKHILFIMLKVLQVSRESGHWYQKALLTNELKEIFASAPLAPNSMAHPQIREAYARVTGKTPAAPALTQSSNKRRVPGPDDDCPVCYDSMHNVSESALTFCEDCGNALHKECFVQWQRTAASLSKDLTCVWCRARWVLGPATGSAGTANIGEDGYLNLAGVGGVSPVRDTSTYYNGPRRGIRYCRRY